MRNVSFKLCLFVLSGILTASTAPGVESQNTILSRADNKPLDSLARAAEEARNETPRLGPPREVPNFRRSVPFRWRFGPAGNVQDFMSFPNDAEILTSFDGSSNDDNAAVIGFRVSPPDTDGDVGPRHYVQMINLITTVFDKMGNIVPGGSPFPSNAFWDGMGGNCEPFNQGDPIALYDETADRWLVSQFAFNSGFTTFSQCVAISQSSDPLGAYNRYEFNFDMRGLPDYPKLGLVSDSITFMANIFAPPLLVFDGVFLGAMDKNAMYAGNPAALVGSTVRNNEFGFVAADLDDPTGDAGFIPALFATAMSRDGLFDIWELDVNWSTGGEPSLNRIAAIPISDFGSDFCFAPREACIPQPAPGSALEALSDRMMHRLQIRDFRDYRTMVAAHTVNVGSGRAGIRWYEMRETGGVWALHQLGTYAPRDNHNRWIPSIAMNAQGDIGLGFLLSSTSMFMSTGVTGQSAAFSGLGVMDAREALCQAGIGAQTGSARSGDYSATNVDPDSDTFWHTNEYGDTTGSARWATTVCEFQIKINPGVVRVRSVVTGLRLVDWLRVRGQAIVTIEDGSGGPVFGATVTGSFHGAFSGTVSGTTRKDGRVTFSSPGAAPFGAWFTFTVDDVSHPTLSYAYESSIP